MSKLCGENVAVSFDGDDLVLRIKHAVRGEKSSTGKSTTVGTTRGNVAIETPSGVLQLGVNCYLPIKK